MGSTDLRVVCIICARGGSKGLPRKNLQLLGGIPLIARPIIDALESGVVDSVIVSTDDPEIEEVACRYGAEVPFRRPPELAGDLTTTEDTIRHTLLEYERLTNSQFDIGVHVTATDIFRRPVWIREAVEVLQKRPEIESVFSGHSTHKNFWEQEPDGTWTRLRPWMATYSSRQVRKVIVREDTGLACASRTWLWREGRRIGDKIMIIVNDDDFTGIDIHTKEDLELAEAALKIRGTA